MPLKDYGVLVGRVADRKIEAGNDSPHYQVHVVAGGIAYRIAVNVRSAQSPPDLLYIADEAFKHPVLPTLDALSDGLNGVPSGPGGVALDYIRGNLFDRNAMRTLPSASPGPDNDLSDKIDTSSPARSMIRRPASSPSVSDGDPNRQRRTRCSGFRPAMESTTSI